MTYSYTLKINYAGGTSLSFFSVGSEEQAISTALNLCAGCGQATVKTSSFDYSAGIGEIIVEVK